MIEEDAKEIAFQKLLDQNWWMLGGHYVWRIGKRHWTNRETVDIMLKSADGFFEIIELKRSSPQIFKLDHDQWIVTAEVNDAVNQAAQYISFIEMDRASIFKRFNVDLHKIKAKVLIGWIAEEDEFAKQKREALRIYNSHLHGIQVMTYDELVRVADNVINANMGESGQETFDEEIPF